MEYVIVLIIYVLVFTFDFFPNKSNYDKKTKVFYIIFSAISFVFVFINITFTPEFSLAEVLKKIVK